MAKICITDRSIARQRQISTALCQLMEEKPYHEISIIELCERAQVSRRSFYRYFVSKDDALNAVLLDVIQQCDLYVMFEYREDVRGKERLTRFFSFWKDQNAKWLHVLGRNNLESTLIKVCLYWIRTEGRAIYRKDAEGELEDLAASFSVTGVVMVLFDWCARGFSETPQEMTRRIAKLLTRFSESV